MRYGTRTAGQSVAVLRTESTIAPMRILIQRVTEAQCDISGKTFSQIGGGVVVLVGIGRDDADEDIEYLARKLVALRIFDDSDGIMNLSLAQTGGEVMIVSQFTLQASTRRGNRPSWIKAAPEEISRPLYDRFVRRVEELLGKRTATGVFGADMRITLTNDGPVTIWIDSHDRD